jgi:hypothetical protein
MRIRIGAIRGYPLGCAQALWTRLSASPPTENPRALNLMRAAVLASSVLLMLPGAWGHSVTVVEFAHLPAGLAAWQRHSLGIYRVCGPVSKFLYALPSYLAGVRVDYPESFDSDIQSRREWELGQIFQKQNKTKYHAIYRLSRLFPILITILGGCLVCEWSTRLFGIWPGFVSLCLWSWMPPVLAHGSLVTSDMLSAVILIMAARSFWGFLIRPNMLTAVPAGIILGLAVATKFTLLILYPCWLLLLIGRVLKQRDTSVVGRGQASPSPTRLAASGILILIISFLILNSVYMFQGIGFRLAQWQFGHFSPLRDLNEWGKHGMTAWLLQIPWPIPAEFLRGLEFQLTDTEQVQSAYLMGSSRLGGFWYWYLGASLFKVPLPAAVLFGLALLQLPRVIRRGEASVWAALCLLIPAAEVAFMISATTGTGTNASFRYLLPGLALLCVWSGRAWSSPLRTSRLIVIALLGWLGLNAIVGLPDHLGWQNELGWAWRRWTGRPALIGDSLDWGQDLSRLGDWASIHSSEGSILVCAYGLGDAEPYGLYPPMARPTSDRWEGCSYLAVSEQVLLGNDTSNFVKISGKQPVMDSAWREALLQASPLDRVGRTIRIYRIRDPGPQSATVPGEALH